jgi:hypothetical protein
MGVKISICVLFRFSLFRRYFCKYAYNFGALRGCIANDCGETAGSIFRVSALKRDAAGLSELCQSIPHPYGATAASLLSRKYFVSSLRLKGTSLI